MQKQVSELLAADLIKSSDSLWQSPVVLAAKKDTAEPRFCIDLRSLNAQLRLKFFSDSVYSDCPRRPCRQATKAFHEP